MKSTFEKMLEIQTWKQDFQIKAVYVPDSLSSWWWDYFIYYYDLFSHTFYINDIDRKENRTSAINIIEHIVSKAYKQEIDSFVWIVKKILNNKKPKIFCLYHQKISWEIIIDKVSLKIIRDKKWDITSFENPSWQRCKNDMNQKFAQILENKSSPSK